MIKKMCGALLVLLFLQCTLSLPSAGQGQIPSICTALQTRWAEDGPVPFGWFVYSSYPGTFAYVIATMLCGPQSDCHCSAGQAARPISLATGETFIEQRDVNIPGLGGGLSRQDLEQRVALAAGGFPNRHVRPELAIYL